MRMRISVLLTLGVLGLGSKCSSSHELTTLPWDQERATRDLKFISLQPHPLGSPRIAVLADYLEKDMQKAGLETGRDVFTAPVPDPELLLAEPSLMRSTTISIRMQNIYARARTGRESCVFLLGSHYDSKRLASGEGLGANDSGSSSVALLELMRGLQSLKRQGAIDFRCHILAVWFDAEESHLPEWRDGQTRHPARIVDNTYGSRHLADSLKDCGKGDSKNWCLPEAMGGEKVEGLILLDMVGSPAQKLTPEAMSTRELLDIAIEVDRKLFAGKLYGGVRSNAVEDDHIPFLEKGIPSLDIINFENLDTWHQPTDTFATIDMKSIEESAHLTHGILEAVLGSK